ncbi:MAG: class I SAM-dependent methyltransferase [Patulibacter sp.]
MSTGLGATLERAGFDVEPFYGELGATIYSAFAQHDRDESDAIARIVGRGLRILELACGDGRVMLPLLLRGNEVVGVDDSAPMLAILEQRLARLRHLDDRWALAHQSMTESVEGAPFDWVVIAAGTITLLAADDRQIVYRRVAEALDPQDGRFLLSSWGFAEGAEPSATTRLVHLDNLGIVVTFHEELAPSKAYRDVYVVPSLVGGAPVSGKVLHSRTAVLPIEQLVAELENAGLTIERRIELPQGDRVAELLVARPGRRND